MMGRRTIRELASAAVPTRVYFVLAGLAVVAALGMTLLSLTLRAFGPEWIANETQHYAQTFRAMPLWFLVGGSLSQFAIRLNAAMDDLTAWRNRDQALKR